MNAMKPIDFVFTLICDDVRREDNGKELLIGVYSAGITVPLLPTNVTVVIWSQTKIHEPGDYKVRYRVLDEAEKELVISPVATIHIEKLVETGDQLSSLAMGAVPLKVEKAGLVHFEVKLNDGEWKRIKTIRISVQ